MGCPWEAQDTSQSLTKLTTLGHRVWTTTVSAGAPAGFILSGYWTRECPVERWGRRDPRNCSLQGLRAPGDQPTPCADTVFFFFFFLSRHCAKRRKREHVRGRWQLEGWGLFWAHKSHRLWLQRKWVESLELSMKSLCMGLNNSVIAVL